jgi:hypothetical protein
MREELPDGDARLAGLRELGPVRGDALVVVKPAARVGERQGHGGIRADERGVGRLRQLDRPGVEDRLVGLAMDPVECVQPLGQVVEVLAVAIPLEPGVEWVARPALGERLADPEPAPGGVLLALALGAAADPAPARVVRTVPPQHVVHLIDEAQRQVEVAALLYHSWRAISFTAGSGRTSSAGVFGRPVESAQRPHAR